MKKVASYGSWKSPITADLIVQKTIGFGQLAIDGEDVYWIERRPQEKGRGVIIKRSKNGETTEVNPSEYNARTRVHEYGGGDYLVHNGVVYFTNFADQNIYEIANSQNGEWRIKNLTNTKDICYADYVMDENRNRLIAIREDRTKSVIDAVNSIAAIDLATGKQTILVQGNDFYSNPRISPDGTKLAWLTWNHPNMPWDETELWMAEITADGTLSNEKKIAGEKEESIFQPEWAPDGTLYFVSDKTNWWNLYRFIDAAGPVSRQPHSHPQGDPGRGAPRLEPPAFTIEPFFTIDAELGKPQWVFGMSTYGFLDTGELLTYYSKDGELTLTAIDTKTKTQRFIDVPFSGISELRVQGNTVLLYGYYIEKSAEVCILNHETGEVTTVKEATTLRVEKEYLPVPQSIEFPTSDNAVAYANFYPPTNKEYDGPEGENPPVIVFVHGGPTSAAVKSFDLKISYWTSRGFAIVDLNYRGSTGFGRKYRDALKDNWGIADVEDAVHVVKYLGEKGLVDPTKAAISGGSAGGYTVLAALTFKDTFKAGASYYGISDLELLAHDIHKFESRYLDSLVGPYPQEKQRYIDRSPIHFTDKLKTPVIFFQGLEDLIVPPNQAEVMVEALKEKKVPVAYVPFEGEQHGFRQSKNIKRALEGEYYFYSKVFGFGISDSIDPVQIDNLG